MGSSLHAELPAWPSRPVPPTEGVVRTWGVSTTAELAGLRAEIRRSLGEQPTTSPDQGAAGERLLLVVEELTSNALRHGELPVSTTITFGDLGWLLAVSDAALDRPPFQDVDRDPAQGGLGLKLVAMLSSAHGWITGSDQKHVWAFVPHRPGDPPALDRPGA